MQTMPKGSAIALLTILAIMALATLFSISACQSDAERIRATNKAANTPVVEPSERIRATNEAINTPVVEPTATNTPAVEPTATNTPVAEPTATNTPAVEPTATNADIRAEIDVIDIQEGDCIDSTLPEGVSIESVVIVPCNGPWQYKVLNSFTLPEFPRYPGRDQISQQAIESCDPRSAFYLFPLTESWSLGDREVTCLQESFGLSVTDPAKLDSLVKLRSLTVGECFVDAPETGYTLVEIVDCSNDWEYQITSVFSVSSDGEYPGDRYFQLQAEQKCGDSWDIYYFPHSEMWSLGDRGVVCIRESASVAMALTPTPQPTDTLAPDPTATPRTTPTPRPTATPRPTPTPRPTATPRPTSEWQLRNYDWTEFPHLLLFGIGPNTSDESYVLNVQCDSISADGSLTFEIYVTSEENPTHFDLSATAKVVSYTVDEKKGHPISWPFETILARTDHWFYELFYPPQDVKATILTTLLDGARQLEVTIDPGESHSETYTFSTHGFTEAAKPVLAECSDSSDTATLLPTPRPTPTLPPTGYWSTARAFGSGDFQTTYINMFGTGPSDNEETQRSSDPEEWYELTFRCDEGREFQFTVNTFFEDDSSYEEYSSEWIPVQYGTGTSLNEAESKASQPADEDGPRYSWWQQYDGDDTIYLVFASEEAVAEIMDRFQQGDSWLVVRLTRFSEEEEQYEFLAEGFNEAAKPVFSGCRR